MNAHNRPYFRETDYLGSRRYRKMSMDAIVIAIDGPAASGKGTLARKLAERMGFAFLDTGAIYRCAAHYLLKTLGASADDKEAAIKAARYVQANLDTKWFDNPEIRAEDVSQATSKIAAISEVREILLDAQREYAKNPPEINGSAAAGSVLDGRDIGTVVCPNADIKLFITASTEVRAERRYQEMIARGKDVQLEEIIADMKERDARDQGRDVAPLKPAEDSFIIDTSGQNPKEVLARAIDIIRGHLAQQVAQNAP